EDESGPDSRWAEHIKAHTSGQISKDSSIKIIFNNDLIDSSLINSSADSLISFSPGIKGKAEWSAANEITFTPEKSLPSGERYKATMDLKQYVKIDKEAGKFFFHFEVIHQDFDINFTGLKYESLKNLSIQQYHGILQTADKSENESIEKILSASQDGKNLKIEWVHVTDSNRHEFTVQNVERKKDDSILLIKWNGKSISVKRDGENKITVPARGVFEVTNAEAVVSDEQFVSLYFSDPLDQKQNLKGLVSINGYPIRTVIDMNIVRIYPTSKITGDVEVFVDPGVKNSEGKKLGKRFSKKMTFELVNPGVRFVGDGTILPDVNNLTVPFEAVNVRSVQVTAMEVYGSNMGQFFQVNNFKGSSELKRVGRYLWRKTIYLNASHEELAKWTRYSLDVSELYKDHPDSLFQLTLSINRSNSALPCEGNTDPAVKEPEFSNQEGTVVSESSYWDYSEDYYNEDYENAWENRKNPCFDSYYKASYGNPVTSSKNFIASNIGIIAKYGSGKTMKIVTTDIPTALPLSTEVKIFNYQHQLIGECKTDGSGFGTVTITGEGDPFLLTAISGSQKGYLKLSADASLPVSHFDVGGEIVNDGVKGYIYGERGVWRPGDTMYLTFVLEDKDKLIPENHPMSLELFNPQGQLVKTVKQYRKTNDFSVFEVSTNENDVSGNWTAKIKLGGLVFSKTLKIETVVPNRLKINLDFGKEILHQSEFPLNTKIFAQWLHGGTAENLETDVSVTLSPRTTTFSRYKDYTFDDFTRSFSSSKIQVFSGNLDATGNTSFNLSIPVDKNPPGMLDANFSSRVYEPGGDYSTETFSIPYHPYKYYVGIKLPKGDEARGMLLTDTDHELKIATIDSDGKPVSRNNLEVVLYKISWKWWWDKSGDDLANFTSADNAREIAKGTVSTRNGEGTWKFNVKYPEWGRFLVRVYDPDGKHSTSKICYIDWPGWAGRAQEEKGVGATRLNFSSDKAEYEAGEKAVIFLPAVSKGYALLSIENGKKVIEQKWIETKDGDNKIILPLTKEMSPNIYVHVSLIQPHKGKTTDTPLRLYGIIPILVKNKETKLDPVLTAASEIKPEQKTEISISEKNNREMTYTIAIVDEGLLGLTRYQTPDLQKYFYKREALGVKTWDLFDDIVGSYSGQLERIIALGGGDGGAEKKQLEENRFPPVVKFLGPFKLEKGEKKKHSIQLPPYIGAVRIMVVAGQNGAYGSAEKSVLVRQPLMILTTLPRVLGPDEDVQIPVAVFAKSKDIKKVTVTVKDDKNLKFTSEKTKVVTFDKPGDTIVTFSARTSSGIGRAAVSVDAVSGKETANQTISVEIRSPNPPENRITLAELKPGEKWNTMIAPFGLDNTNSAVIEVSSLPPINLEKRLDYLIQYPHGCLEQTTSSVFPQLYLSSLTDMTKEKKALIDSNINAGIARIRQFQITSGALTYWPGQEYQINDWTSVYAGHFLAEAEKAGYSVPSSLLVPWTKYQTRVANSWNAKDTGSALIQAYRLYVLALVKSPSAGAMNRLKESDKLNNTGRYLLAAAFYISGQKKAAEEITANTAVTVEKYNNYDYTFGSELRDNSVILNTLTVMGQKMKGKKLADEITGQLASKTWYSTQSTAFGLMAISNFIGRDSGSYSFSYSAKIGSKSENKKTDMAISVFNIPEIPMSGIPAEIVNTDKKSTIYVTMTLKGSPAPGKETTSGKGLKIYAEYKDTSGADINVLQMKQGKDFSAVISVTNNSGTDIRNIALSHIIPSGWQIHNSRFETGTIASNAEYQDFRDDRVYTYFSLNSNETKKFTIMLNATFLGKYYMPGITAEDMYNAEIKASVLGSWVQIQE
ncbi:MAG: hypothetical protein JW982_07140, partial [Spirochaetes bacterium]|nr:hypothetical protein [Spirochaetota bacterium]